MNMITSSLRRNTALVFVLAAGAALTAQESGTISGVVRDSAGRPLQGVQVSITSPNMLGVRNVTTNERGEYRAPLLPVGSYRVSVSRQGYLGQRAENIRVGLGAAVSQNFTMRDAAVASATVDISAGGEVGLIDKTETGAKTNVSAETLAQLPVSRTFGGAAQLTPGIASGPSGQLNVRGGQSQQTMYRLNGADVKDDYQGVLVGYGAVADNIEDVQVVLSETHARFGRSLGGSINVITKSGSNEFSGSLRAEFDRQSWRGTNVYQVYRGNVYTDDLSRQFQYTLNGPIIKDRLWFAIAGILTPTTSATYGIATNLAPNFQTGLLYAPETYERDANGNLTTTGVYPDLNHPVNQVLINGPNAAGFVGNWAVRNPIPGDRYGYLMDAGRQYQQTSNSGRNEFKLTAMPVQNHTVEVSYVRETSELGPRNPYGDSASTTSIYRIAQLGDQSSVRQIYNYGYRGIIGDSIFIEARFNKTDNVVDWPYLGGDVAQQGEIVFTLGNRLDDRLMAGVQSVQPWGRGLGAFRADRSNRSGNLNIKWIKDLFGVNNEIDAGVDYFGAKIWEVSADAAGFRLQVPGVYTNYAASELRGREPFLIPTVNFVAGGINGQISSGTYGPASVYFQMGGVEGLNFTDSWSYYVNDKFVINQNWNGMIGLRYESTSMTNSRGAVYAENTFLSPRLQLTYDWKGDGSHLFTATAARYGTDYNARLADTLSEKAGDIAIRWGWSANPVEVNDPLDPLGLYGVRFVTYEQLINPDNYKRLVNYVDASKGRIVQDLENPYLDEFTVGYKRQLRNGSSVGITYVNRAWRNDWAARSEYTLDYFAELTDPINDPPILANQYQQQTRWFSAGGDLMRDYQGLEMDFTARLNSYWTVGGNWTISRLTGNDEGGDNTGSFADYASKPYYNNRSLFEPRGITTDMVSPYGRLINDQTNRGRFYAILNMPLGQGHISFSPVLYYNSATPTSLTINNRIPGGTIPQLMRPDGQGALPGNPSSYTEYWNGRGWRQENDHFYVDFKISFAVPLGMGAALKRMQIMGDITVTNLFNARIYNDGFFDYMQKDLDGYFRWYNSGSLAFGAVDPANVGADGAGTFTYWRTPRVVTATLGLRF